MAIESDADRAVFLSNSDFGIVVTVGVSTFDAITDRAFQEIVLGGAGIASVRPFFIARDIDLTAASLVEGSTATIGGVNYSVVEIEPDGTGMTNVILDKQ